MTMYGFNKSSGLLFRKFANGDSNVKIKLLNVLRMSLYRTELWTDRTGSMSCFKQFGVA